MSEEAGMSENRAQDNPERLLFDIWLVSRATTGLLDAALAPVGLTADEFALHSTDGRSAFLQLTDQGEAAYHQAREIFVPIHERIAAILTVSVGDAQAMLAELSRAIHQAHAEREAGQGETGADTTAPLGDSG
jgi:hypothetical protein